jgi:hypothetical protein
VGVEGGPSVCDLGPFLVLNTYLYYQIADGGKLDIGVARNVGFFLFYCTERECSSFGKCLIKFPYETSLFAFIYARRGTCINAWRCRPQRASSV